MILNMSRGSIKVALEGKTVTVPGEMFFPENEKLGFVVFSNQIKHWNFPDQEIELTQEDVAHVLGDIQADFDKGGHSLEIE